MSEITKEDMQKIQSLEDSRQKAKLLEDPAERAATLVAAGRRLNAMATVLTQAWENNDWGIALMATYDFARCFNPGGALAEVTVAGSAEDGQLIATINNMQANSKRYFKAILAVWPEAKVEVSE